MPNIERCNNCQRIYRIEELGAKMPGPTKKQEVICPYCYSSYTATSNGSFITFKLTTEQEKDFLNRGG